VVAPINVIVPSSTKGQNGILLGLIKTVNFIDEQDRFRLIKFTPLPGFLNDAAVNQPRQLVTALTRAKWEAVVLAIIKPMLFYRCPAAPKETSMAIAPIRWLF